jgi:hypothetical protein
MKRFIGLAAFGIAFAMVASAAYAQPVTGTTYLSNIDPNGPAQFLNAWSSPAYTINSTALGLEIAGPGGSGSFGQMYYPLPANQVTPVNTADTQVTFNYLWNSGDAVAGVQAVLALDDANGGVNYYFTGYNVPTPGLNSYTFALQQPNQGNVTAGYPINGMSIQLDPANVNGNYDITFSSVTLSAVPEPASLGVTVLGAGLLGLRRRSSARAK